MINSEVVAQSASLLNAINTVDLFWLWGQSIDHDLDETLIGTEKFNFEVSAGDPSLDPENIGIAVIPFNRSVSEIHAGVDLSPLPRGQFNTLRFEIPAALLTALRSEPGALCTINTALSKGVTPVSYAIDRVAFE